MYKMYIIGIGLLVLSGCGDTDERVIERAHTTYEIMDARYRDFSDTMSEQEVLRASRALALQQHVGFWGLLTHPDLSYGTSAPLIRAVYIMECDMAEIDRFVGQMESRGLSRMSLYTQLMVIRDILEYVMRTIKLSDKYVEERRFIDERYMDERQLIETKKQTYLLQEIADTARR